MFRNAGSLRDRLQFSCLCAHFRPDAVGRIADSDACYAAQHLLAASWITASSEGEVRVGHSRKGHRRHDNPVNMTCMSSAGTDAMVHALLPDELWSLIETCLPVYPRSQKGGRPRIDNRAAMTGILFVLKTGIPWEYLPRELGCASGMSCWRRLHEWMQAGVWQRIHEAILRRLREYDQIEWNRASIDAASVPSPFGGEHTGRNPYRSRQAGLQAPCSRGSARTTTGSTNLWSTSARFPDAHTADERNSCCDRVARSSS
jgi:transposase